MLRPTALLRVGDVKVRSTSARPPRHACDEDEQLQLLQLGHAELKLHDRSVTKAERAAWRRDDQERDRRRIPLGFRAP